MSGMIQPGGLGKHKFQQQIIAVISVAVEALHARFGSLINKDSQCPAYTTIDCFKFFNHDTWPENEDILLDYGSEQVDVKSFSRSTAKVRCYPITL